MVKSLDSRDFRSRRKVLEPSDFALHSGERDVEPSDLIDQETWNHLTNLPDNVAICTSSHFGTPLKTLVELKNEWLLLIEANNPKHPCLALTMLPAYEELDAAIFNLLHGYYKQAFECLRNFLEQILVGVYLDLRGDKEISERWVCGISEIKCGEACDWLQHYEPIVKFEAYLTSAIDDNFFEQKNKVTNPNNRRGWVRRLFGKLSKFPHPNLGYANGDLWESNGPIFDLNTFNRFEADYFETMMLSILLLKLARIDLTLPTSYYGLSKLDLIQKLSVAKSSTAYLFKIPA